MKIRNFFLKRERKNELYLVVNRGAHDSANFHLISVVAAVAVCHFATWLRHVVHVGDAVGNCQVERKRGLLIRVLASGPISRPSSTAALEFVLERVHYLRARIYHAVFILQQENKKWCVQSSLHTIISVKLISNFRIRVCLETPIYN